MLMGPATLYTTIIFSCRPGPGLAIDDMAISSCALQCMLSPFQGHWDVNIKTPISVIRLITCPDQHPLRQNKGSLTLRLEPGE